ncbi:MAG: amino acid transporter [Candidatus Melainabacteria bacterium]|nr:amino acid transporter [Candidatus Melainabacteria bacterium]
MASRNRFERWFFEGLKARSQESHQVKAPWYKVMCLTGVDYFSSLGYQPGIAFLAAGILSPIATLIVILVTLFGLIPLYSRVAKASPHGQGSIAMLEDLLPSWYGKALILVLLGFAATDFIITITLSAADATAHVVENPFIGSFVNNRELLTIAILALLGAIFLKGFREAIGVSVFLVALYLLCNCAVVVRASTELLQHPQSLDAWYKNVTVSHGNIWSAIGVSMILFPKLALGMSGFETGVAVMPLVEGNPNDTREKPEGRIANTRKLLAAAAIIMAILLIFSSVLTTVLIPPEQFQAGGAANGRALAYLAHKFLGSQFGTVYDISTILILWFAGASAMAGLLNLVPRYLPRFGMAPDWSRAQRPLVVFFTCVAFFVTWVFKADVDAQAGAYATGVLVLFASAALAVALSVKKESWDKKVLFWSILLVFVYTTVANMIERPEGLHIASFFIAAIILVSLVSRSLRSLELRLASVHLDIQAASIIDEMLRREGSICLLARRPGGTNYKEKEISTRRIHKLTVNEAHFIFLEVELSDPSEFEEDCLDVQGQIKDGHPVLSCKSPAIPNAIAAVLLHLRDKSTTLPRAYFGWTEGSPISYVFKYIFLGEGETAPVTREVLRLAEPDPLKRPEIIVG